MLIYVCTYARPFFLTKEKLRAGMPHSNFCTVPSGAVGTYKSKFILNIDKYTYVRIQIPRPLPLGESRPDNKVRKKVGISKTNIHTDILLRM